MFLAFKNKKKFGESGELMIEAMIVVIITIFVLLWLLAVGFVYYQRYVATIATNDVAVKVASTYNNPTSDIIMGYVTTEDLSRRDLYRNFATDGEASNLRLINEDRAEAYVRYKMDKGNFAGTVDNVDVKLELVTDPLARKHVEVTSVVTFNTPFGQVMELFGFNGKHKYEIVASADCTDMADHISTVDFANSLESLLNGTGFFASLLKMINSFIKVYNTFGK